MIKFNLQQNQLDLFNALSELYLGPRGSGRTYVIAYFIIKKAMYNPKKEIDVECTITDEHQGNLFSQVVKLIDSDKRFEICSVKHTIKFIG